MVESGTEITPFPEECAHYKENPGPVHPTPGPDCILYEFGLYTVSIPCIIRACRGRRPRNGGLMASCFAPRGMAHKDPDRPGVVIPDRASAMEDKR